MRRITILIITFSVCLIAATTLVAAPDSPAEAYSISWWTIDGGGGNSQGGPYALGGTVGQADAQTSSGGAYLLTGGFWNETVRPGYRLYLPLIRK
jgi:hypothetical protein